MRIIFISIIFLAIGFSVLWFLPQDAPEGDVIKVQDFPKERVKSDIRDVTPADALKGPDVRQEVLTRLPDKVVPKKEEEIVADKNYRNVSIEKAGFARSKELEIRFAGINPLEPEQKCTTANQESWPCGMFARTAQRRLIRGRTINCDVAEPEDKLITTKCRISGYDISSWLVQHGWAEGEDGAYSKEMEEAKKSFKGMWRKDLP